MNSSKYSITDGKLLLLDQELASIKLDLQPGVHWFCQDVLDPTTGKRVVKNRLTASAYDQIASVLGISTTMAECTIGEGGEKRANPHITQRNGIIESVLVRVYAVGRGPTGNVRCVDVTLLHSPYATFCSDLYEKWLNVQTTGNDQRPNPQSWGSIVQESVPLPPNYLRFPVAAIPGVYLQVEAMNPVVLMLMRQLKDSSLFAERAAYSMATRAAIGKLTGIRYADKDGSLTVQLWQSFNPSRKEIEEIAASETVERESIEAGQDETDGVDDVVDSPEHLRPVKPIVVSGLDEARKTIKESVLKLHKTAEGKEKVKRGLASIGVESMKKLGEVTDVSLLSKLGVFLKTE
jgi:hypothetical protein